MIFLNPKEVEGNRQNKTAIVVSTILNSFRSIITAQTAINQGACVLMFCVSFGTLDYSLSLIRHKFFTETINNCLLLVCTLLGIEPRILDLIDNHYASQQHTSPIIGYLHWTWNNWSAMLQTVIQSTFSHMHEDDICFVTLIMWN